MTAERTNTFLATPSRLTQLYGDPTPSTDRYVDRLRTDPYVETGTILLPYRTIADAVQKVSSIAYATIQTLITAGDPIPDLKVIHTGNGTEDLVAITKTLQLLCSHPMLTKITEVTIAEQSGLVVLTNLSIGTLTIEASNYVKIDNCIIDNLVINGDGEAISVQVKNSTINTTISVLDCAAEFFNCVIESTVLITQDALGGFVVTFKNTTAAGEFTFVIDSVLIVQVTQSVITGVVAMVEDLSLLNINSVFTNLTQGVGSYALYAAGPDVEA